MNEIKCPTCDKIIIQALSDTQRVEEGLIINTVYICNKCNETYYRETKTQEQFLIISDELITKYKDGVTCEVWNRKAHLGFEMEVDKIE